MSEPTVAGVATLAHMALEKIEELASALVVANRKERILFVARDCLAEMGVQPWASRLHE